ncbi:BURP domain protein RD22, partial [Mucuna pruriens]
MRIPLQDEFSSNVNGAKKTQPQNELPFYLYGDKKTQSQNELPFYFYDGKETQSQGELPFYLYGDKKTQSQGMFPFYLYGDKKIQSKDKKTQSQDELPFYLYGDKKTQSKEPHFYLYGDKKTQSENKKIQSQDKLLFYLYGDKKIQSEDELPFYFYGDKKTQSENKITQSQDKFSFYLYDEPPFYLYGDKKTQLQDEPPFYLYGDKKTQSQDEFPFYLYGDKKTQSQDEFPFYLYGAKKTKSQDELPFYLYGAKDSESNNDVNALPPKMMHATNHHQHDNPNVDLIFFEEGLRPGTKLDAQFPERKYASPLLPRQVAERIPFSSEKIKEILKILSLKPMLENVQIVENGISQCEGVAMKGEEKHCATSLESMVDFITSKLGKNVGVISTEVEKETKSTKFLVKDGVKMLAEDKFVACHPVDYPYAIFYCHQVLNTTAHFVPLEGEDGTRAKAVALCHKDTSGWGANHISFRVLKIKPGTAPVCHIFPEGHLLWIAK